MIIRLDKIITSKKTSKWCKLPYNGKPGCPMYGKKDVCPPSAPLFFNYFDRSKPMYFVVNEFDLKAHREKIKTKHPHWTFRQCNNVLYWQATARKQLKEKVEKAVIELNCDAITFCPEAMGLNVFATAIKNGLAIEKTRHINVCRHIAVIGHKI